MFALECPVFSCPFLSFCKVYFPDDGGPSVPYKWFLPDCPTFDVIALIGSVETPPRFTVVGLLFPPCGGNTGND